MENRLIETIQAVELDALKEFDKFCKKNDLHYFLRGGSVLGAVKYRGFIPWDDDMDIAVPRDDYERLIELTKDVIIGNKYRINSYRYCNELHCYFPRMVLLEEERVRLELPKNTKLGLHLMDIFPLDGAPDNYVWRQFYFLKVYIMRALASLGTIYDGPMVNMHSRKQQFVIDLLRFLKIDKLVDQREVYARLEKLYTKYNWKKQKYAGTITASLFKAEVMPSQIWGKGEYIPFEDTYMCVPEMYDIYLKNLYGKNYLIEEPKEDERKSHLAH